MKIHKAVITAGGPQHRRLPLQTLVDRQGNPKSVLALLLEEALAAQVEDIAVVVWPGDEEVYAEAAGTLGRHVRFLAQPAPLGYAHAVWCAREFADGEPFLHMVGDHLPVCREKQTAAQKVVALAEREETSVSAVQATRENLLPYFGVVAGPPVHGNPGLYKIEQVAEKPTPTEAEQRLVVAGLRAGHYLGFFGVHVFSPVFLEIVNAEMRRNSGEESSLAESLEGLSRAENYLALEVSDRRYDLGSRYGLLEAQMALALSGQDRDQVLSRLLELFAMRELEEGIGR